MLSSMVKFALFVNGPKILLFGKFGPKIKIVCLRLNLDYVEYGKLDGFLLDQKRLFSTNLVQNNQNRL